MYKLFKESFVVMSEADKIKLLQAFYYEGRTMSLDFIFQKNFVKIIIERTL